MVEIVFESHSTTVDNEAGVASGWNDVELSGLGKQQALELGKRRSGENFDAIFCSDLQRSYKTAEIAFGKTFKIIKDKCLREVNYGDLSGLSEDIVKPQKPAYIHNPFPSGESYEQTSARIKNFLKDLLRDYDGKRVMIIGHRATQYALEHWINSLSLEEIIPAPWKWQPGWTYRLKTFG